MANSVYIFGNGFDIRMSMPTAYSDFFKYYETTKNHATNISSIKNAFISKVNKEKDTKPQWADLEQALGIFTKDVSNVQQFKVFYRDFSRELNKYLISVEQRANEFSDEDKKKFLNDLMSPGNYLHLETQKKNFKAYISDKDINADIITLNYTKTIELLLNWENDNTHQYNIPQVLDSFKIQSIKHIHGILNSSDLLFGLNDISQIANKEFHKDKGLLNLMIKPTRNDELGTNIDKECMSLIENADIFYFFGTSLGPTDQLWWNLVGNRFKSMSNTVIVYFDYKEKELEKDMMGVEYVTLESPVRQRIMDIMKISGNEKDYRNRIYVACNSGIYPNLSKKLRTF